MAENMLCPPKWSIHAAYLEIPVPFVHFFMALNDHPVEKCK